MIKKNKPDMTEREQFYKLEERKKIKYLICTEQGQAHLKEKNLYLIKSKIAKAKLTEQELLIGKTVMDKAIQDRLGDPLLSNKARKNLESKIVQDCLVVRFMDLPEAENLSVWTREILENMWPRFQEDFGNGRLSKEEFLSLKEIDCRCLKFLHDNNTSLAKKITIRNVVQHSMQVQLLIEKPAVSKLVQHGRRTLNDIFLWGPAETKVWKIDWVENLITEAMKGDAVFFNSELTEKILDRAQLLLDITAKFSAHVGPSRIGLSNYLREVWKDNLILDHCVHANPDALSALLLFGLDGEIASLVNDGCISLAELLKLEPDQIKVLANKKVKWALENGHLKSRKISRLGAKEILDSASALYGEKAHLEKNCITQ